MGSIDVTWITVNKTREVMDSLCMSKEVRKTGISKIFENDIPTVRKGMKGTKLVKEYNPGIKTCYPA